MLLLAGCDDAVQSRSEIACTIPEDLLFNEGIPKDAIPALTDPPFVDPSSPEASYVEPQDRITGVVADGQPLALPHKLLAWHEIVNLTFPGSRVAVTYRPLTGSALAFDRAVVGGAEFGVTGFLLHGNLVMYDRTDRESLWLQMSQRAVCGPRATDGEVLDPLPILMDMTLEGWTALHPETKIASSDTGFQRDYGDDTHAEYSRLDNTSTGGGIAELDDLRPPKELVLGIASPRARAAWPSPSSHWTPSAPWRLSRLRGRRREIRS